MELGAYGGGHLMLGISLIGFVVVEICMVYIFFFIHFPDIFWVRILVLLFAVKGDRIGRSSE